MSDVWIVSDDVTGEVITHATTYGTIWNTDFTKAKPFPTQREAVQVARAADQEREPKIRRWTLFELNVCWNCGVASLFKTEPDPGMNGVTDRVVCTACGESQSDD